MRAGQRRPLLSCTTPTPGTDAGRAVETRGRGGEGGRGADGLTGVGENPLRRLVDTDCR